MNFRGNTGRNSHVSSAWKETGGRSIHFISRLPERKTKKESTTRRRLRRKLCIFAFRPTHFVHSSNDCPHRCSKSTICPFASWGTMGKARTLRVRNFPFFVQVRRQKAVISPPKAVNSILKIGQLAVYSDICGSNLPKCAVAVAASPPFSSQTSR